MTGEQLVLDSFEAPPPVEEDRLTVDLGSWEGPLDLLLTLARTQKVDLREMSILALVWRNSILMSRPRLPVRALP